MDIQQLLTGILEKHGSDESFKNGMKADGQGTLIEHFGEEAIAMIKDHLDADSLKNLLSGKGDISEIIGGFLGKDK